jgi:hypothetical protein
VNLIDRFYELLEAGRADALAMLYAPNGEIVRYDRVARTPAEIEAYYEQLLADHPGMRLQQVDRIRHADDVMLWDAVLETDAGMLQTIDVVVLDGDGRIHRHIPGLRGFWGA